MKLNEYGYSLKLYTSKRSMVQVYEIGSNKPTGSVPNAPHLSLIEEKPCDQYYITLIENMHPAIDFVEVLKHKITYELYSKINGRFELTARPKRNL